MGKDVLLFMSPLGKIHFVTINGLSKPMGMLACYGHASEPPDPVDVIELGTRGSLFLTRPAIMHYMAKKK